MNSLERDRQLIASLGGPVKVAARLQLGRYGDRRVSNWNKRGIPPAMKVEHPELFMPELAQAQTNIAQAATNSVAEQGA